MEEKEGGCKDPSQVPSLDTEMGMDIQEVYIGYMGNRIVGKANKFDWRYIHLEMPEGQKNGVLSKRWET